MKNLVVTDFTVTAGAAPVDVDFPAGSPKVAEILWARVLKTPAAGGAHSEVDLTVKPSKGDIDGTDQIAVVDEDTFTIRPAADILIHETLHLNVVEVGEKVKA